MSQSLASTMPAAVDRAQKLVFGLIGVYVVQTVVAFVASDALVDYYAKAHNYTGSFAAYADESAPAYGPIALISLVVVGGLLLVSALSFPKRAGWARIVALVFAVLALLGGLLGFVQDSPIWYRIIVFVGGLLGLAIAALLLSRDSSRWFSKGVATA